MIKAGLINILFETIEKSVNETHSEGKFHVISLIIGALI